MYVIICVGIQRMSICKMLTSVVSLLDAQSEGRNKRQTVLLSATLSPQVERLAGLTLNDPVRLDAADDGHTDKQLVIPQSLAQHYIVTPAKLRLVTLAAFIYWKCQVYKTIPFSLLIVLITVVLSSILFLKFSSLFYPNGIENILCTTTFRCYSLEYILKFTQVSLSMVGKL